MGSFDSEQLSYWFDLCSDRLVLYARQWLGLAQAQDAAQEAFVRLMAQSRVPENVRAWLFKTVRNHAIDLLRKQKRHQKYAEKIAHDQEMWFEAALENPVDEQLIRTVLGKLSEPQREAVILRIWGQLSFKEISYITGQSISTIHSRYQTALANIKNKLELSCPSKIT